jgi:peptidyl-prolyl cis-trans isomerase C
MQVKASHILVATLEEATSLFNQIKTGANFEALAKQHSKCPSSNNGGALGSFGSGQMVQPFEKAAFELPIGSVSGPVQTQFGFHLIHRTG